ncbi:sister chromatid cohesion protein PDS5 homolog C-like isoform X2 [Vicia villosa]|uniref:sister chromatid cohesion protein PDS5 homolog C-like isoform X2 n=1 Tax=Vicia villosa TaxID=3911 RepID=UPI00273B0A91|nr:sister chromatid cohesion protein PDS5 homolog C-like isoform X2 [Vicia villosa]
MTCSTDSIVLSDDDRDAVKRLRHVGRQLSRNLTCSVDQLLQLLDKLEVVLSNLEHDPPKPIQGSLVLPMKTLISDQLLRHGDEDVKISVTACLTQITRITAPNAPYDDEQMKEYLKLAVAAFEKLSQVSGRRYEKAVSILENFSKIKIFVIMLDLECDDLVMEMFQHFLRIIRSNHPSNVIESMENVMTGILDESEDISMDLLRPLLDSVRKANQTISPIGWTLAEKVITNCAVKLKPYLMQAVVSSGRMLDEYPQIVTSICQNQPESQKHNQSLIQAVDNNLDAPKGAHEEPSDVTKGLETDNTCVRDGQLEDDMETNIRSNSAATMDGDVDESSGSKRKLHSSTKNSEKTNPKELVQEMNSETQLDIVPRKRARKPNSLMNPEEGYDHSWICKESSIRKSSQPKRARDNGYALAHSKNPTSTKGKELSNPKTVDQALFSEVKDGKVSIKTSDRGNNFLSCENTASVEGTVVSNPKDVSNACENSASVKGIVVSNPKDVSNVCEALVSKSKNDENTNDDSPRNHNIRNGSFLKRRRSRKSISIRKLKDDNLSPLQEKTSSKSPGVSMEDISKVKESEVKHEAPVRTIKLSIKFDGKVVVPPTPIVASTKSENFCEDEGRSSSQIKVNKRRKQTATSDKGFNKSSAMKGHEPIKLDSSLVGKRIKIWWPLDKMYYEGVVETYDHVRGKYKILYDDGVTEQLNLNKERWELVNVSPEEGLGLQKLEETSDKKKHWKIKGDNL